MMGLAIAIAAASATLSLPFTQSETDVLIVSPGRVQFTQTQILVLYAAGAGTLLVIVGGTIVTVWCRKRNMPGQMRLPEDEGYAAETGVYEIDQL